MDYIDCYMILAWLLVASVILSFLLHFKPKNY